MTERSAWRQRAGFWLAVIGLLCVVVRLPALRYDVISDDEAIYDAMAQSIVAGGVMYRDTVDHKPPQIAHTYALVRRLTGPGPMAMAGVHLLGVLFVLGTCAALYGIGRRLLPEQARLYPPLLYAIVSAAKQPADGLAVNGELLMNFPVALAVLAAVEASRKRGALALALDVLAGLLVGVAALYKYQAAIVGLALPLLIWPDRSQGAPALYALLRRGLAWLLGLALPFAAWAAYFAHCGVLREAVFWGIEFNRSYISQGPDLAHAAGRLALQGLGVILPGCVLYVGAGVAAARWPRRGSRGEAQLFLLGWCAGSLACVAVGRRFFGHYFLQPEAPLALLAAPVVARWARRSPALVAMLLVLPAAIFFAIGMSPQLTRRYFDDAAPDWRPIGEAVRARTTPAQTIWVWGNFPQIYSAAERVHGVRFSFCNYLTGLSPATPSEYDPAFDSRHAIVGAAWPMVMEDLQRRRPELILDTAPGAIKSYGKYPMSDYPALSSYVATHYERMDEIAGVRFYRLRR